MPPTPVDRALSNFDRLLRRLPPDPEEVAQRGTVPSDLRAEGLVWLTLRWDERVQLDELVGLLGEDEAFEHLGADAAKTALWRLACRLRLRRRGAVNEFVAEHRQKPQEHTCFFPVELLRVNSEIAIGSVTLLPPDAVNVPDTFAPVDPQATMTSVVAAPCSGTDRSKMAARARAEAEYALRVCRFALQAHAMDRQLRFQLGQVWWFEDRLSAWSRPPTEGWEVHLNADTLRSAGSIRSLAASPAGEVERQAHVALEWFERAQLELDPAVRILFLFFALESVLGVRSSAQKGHPLAFYRALLDVVMTKSFRDPGRTYTLYDQVRSYAVHGEQLRMAPSPGEADQFAFDVHDALDQFLTFARDRGINKRSGVRRALDEDEARADLVDFLVQNDPDLWRDYFYPNSQTKKARALRFICEHAARLLRRQP